MNFYKIRHKATGLFFKPSRYPHKCNLSKTGKTYHSLPSYDWVRTIHEVEGYRPPTVETRPEDWEVIKYKMMEDEIINFK